MISSYKGGSQMGKQPRGKKSIGVGCCTVFDQGDVVYQQTEPSKSSCASIHKAYNPINEPGDGYQFSEGREC